MCFLFIRRPGWKATRNGWLTINDLTSPASRPQGRAAIDHGLGHRAGRLYGPGVLYKDRVASRVTIIGTTDQYLYSGGFAIEQGRFITASEAEGGRPVCVLGNSVATNLFDGESPWARKSRSARAAWKSSAYSKNAGASWA